MFGWFRKKPVDPKSWAYPYHGDGEEEINQVMKLAKIHELWPDRQYVFWFKQPIIPALAQKISKMLEERGLNILLVFGEEPVVYEFKDGETVRTILDERREDEQRQHKPAVEQKNFPEGLGSGARKIQ